MKLKVPTTRVGQVLFFGTFEMVSFFVLCACNRAQAQGRYGWTFAASFVFSLQGFAIGKLMVDDENARTWWAGFGMALGGAIGDVLSIWITKYLWGQ